MIRYLTATELAAYPKLKASMLRDRAAQFRDRLKWEVSVDEDGFEIDQYDGLDPLYVIWQTPDGGHGGSMRFLPTLGPTMVNDFFADLADGGVEDANIWETTRFCISPTAGDGTRIAALLMVAIAQLGVGKSLSHTVGVFDARMVRIYRKLGWEPEVMGTTGQGREAISAGLWVFAPKTVAQLALKAGVTTELARYWFSRAFGASVPPKPA